MYCYLFKYVIWWRHCRPLKPQIGLHYFQFSNKYQADRELYKVKTMSMDQEPFMSMPIMVEIDSVDRNSTDNRADVIDDTYVISAKYDNWYDN